MKLSTILTVSVLVIGCLACISEAATKPLAKSECKQIQAPPSLADNVVEELIKGVSGKIIEYYNWFFQPKSISGGESRTFGRPIRKLKNALIPLMFWMGIVFSMIKFILFLSMKSVAIGMTILILNLAFVATKIVLFFKGGHATGLVPVGGGYGKDVHVHVHPTPGAELSKPLGGWSDRASIYKNSYYVTEDGPSMAYHASLPNFPASQEHVRKRSANVEEEAIEYELPDQMSAVPPTPNFYDVEKIKNRRSMRV